MLKDSILEKLDRAHRGSKRPLNFGVYYKNTLVALCHALEDFILESGGNPVTIAAFQQGKWYIQEADRYGEIARVASDIVIMAAAGTGFSENPTSQLANVTLVGLEPEDPVAQEWHLMILSPQYTAMVLCQELSAADYGATGQPSEDKERKFYGFWTFEPDLVRETVELTIAHIGSYNKELEQKLTAQLQGMTSGQMSGHDVGKVVSRVVNYLQASQQDLPDASDRQVLDDNLVSNEMQAFLRMAQLIDRADARNPLAAAEVATLSEAMGQILDLPAWQVKRLRLAGLLHRLPSLQGVEETISTSKSVAQLQAMQQGDKMPKASILRIMPQLQAIAQIVAHQTECWDGSGQPDSLAYDEIPLESRILSLVAEFQQQVTIYKGEESTTNPLTRALADCQAQAGAKFDPKLVESLELLVRGLQQGLSLHATQPKIAAGMWLLDGQSEPEAKLPQQAKLLAT
ncbi:MAG: DICT sensory domain-containing protein [Hormoscilla sp.]